MEEREEIQNMRGTQPTLLALKMEEGGKTQEAWAASGHWEWPAGAAAGNKDLSPTTTRNCILPTTQMNKEMDSPQSLQTGRFPRGR